VFALGLRLCDIDIPYLAVSRRLSALPVSPRVTQHVDSEEGAKKVENKDMTHASIELALNGLGENAVQMEGIWIEVGYKWFRSRHLKVSRWEMCFIQYALLSDAIVAASWPRRFGVRQHSSCR